MEKPEALTLLKSVLPQTFETLKRSYKVPQIYYLDLGGVTAATAEQLSQHVDIAAVTLRKIQALHIHSHLGVRTPSDVVIGLCTEIGRAIVSLVRSTPGLPASDRQVLVATLGAVQTCGVVVGTMTTPGEIVILE